MNRRYVAEFLGTFAIVFFGCGSILSLVGKGDAHLMVNLVFGLVVAASIYALGHISAAHFNPAVTIAFAVAKRFPWKFVPGYVVAQMLGAIVASALHAFLLPGTAKAAAFGATIPSLDVSRALVTEVLLTFFLMLVIISVATDRRANGAIPGLAIGMAVALCGLFGGPLSGCSMNPARSLGPALYAAPMALPVLWIYFVGPVIGAVLGATIYEAIRGGDEHGQGAPNDLEMALEKVAAS